MSDRETILQSRWLRRFGHLFRHPSLWHMNRRSVPRALAIGMFAAFILPVGQFLLAALMSLPLRANVPVAATATLVTNPLTFPAIYIGAYELGSFFLDHSNREGAVAVPTTLASRLLEFSGATALGLCVFAVSGAAAGFAVGKAWWRLGLMSALRSRRDCRRGSKE